MISDFEGFDLGTGASARRDPATDLWKDWLSQDPPSRPPASVVISNNSLTVKDSAKTAVTAIGDALKDISGTSVAVKDTGDVNGRPISQPPPVGPGGAPQFVDVPSKKGDSISRIAARAYDEQWESAGHTQRSALLKGIVTHPANQKISKTSRFGYEALIGMPGPMLSPNYSGVNTARGSGDDYPVLRCPLAAI